MTAMDQVGKATERVVQALAAIQRSFAPDGAAIDVFSAWLAPWQAVTDSGLVLIAEWLDTGCGEPGLRLLASSAVRDDGPAAAGPAAQTLPLELEQLLHATARSGCPLISNASTSNSPAAPSSFLGLPLVVGDHVVGLIAVANHPRGYEPELLLEIEPLLLGCAHLLALYIDRRQRLALETRLRQESARQQAVWDGSTDALFLLGWGGRIDAVNPAACRLTGCSTDELLGRSFAGLVQTRQWPALARLLEQGPEQHRQSLMMCNRLGDAIDAEIVLTRLAPASGSAWCCAVRDIRTGRGDAVELARHCEQLGQLLAASPVGVAAFDEHLRLSFSNPALLRLLGWDTADIEGMSFETFERRLLAQAPVGTLLPSALDPGGEERILRLEHPQAAVLVRSSRLTDVPGASVIVYLRDVTRQAEVDRLKSEFLAAAAQELRTPLAGILGFSELLLNRNFHPDTQRELHGTVLRQARAVHRLVEELLDLAQLDARAERMLTIAVHDAGAVLRRVVDALSSRHPGRHIDLDLPETDRPRVRVDARRLEQMLDHVLSNALQYSPAVSRVLVTLQHDANEHPGQVGIAVLDGGIGMTAEQLAEAGRRFFRAQAGGVGTGAGLGLALVRELLEAQGGQLDMSSRPGQGTRVILWVPQGGEVA